jgi:aryl-alcohol dehydrogenase-like predicted oxidoreductase
MLDAVYESGCTIWDTADVYGDSEELIGNWYALSHSAMLFRELNAQ